MKKLRVLVLMHEDLVPPPSTEGLSDKDKSPFKTENDVIQGLTELGHEVIPLGVHADLGPIRDTIERLKPNLTFNVLEEFHGVSVYGQHVISFLELLRQPYTGCNPRGLMLAHDKVLTKKILSYHRLPIPRFAVFPVGSAARRPKRLGFPLLVKSTFESASLGIAQASIVHSDDKLAERVEFMHETYGTDAMAEEYIEGRELYLGVLGNQRLETFPIWEMIFAKWDEDMPRIATAKVKWDLEYQKRHGIDTFAAKDLPEQVAKDIPRLCKLAYRALSVTGYARMDLRLTPEGRVFLIEANANPDLAKDEDFARSAQAVGIEYPALLQRILNLALAYRPAWKQVEEE
jgi:D-alanine-D-alanine ligase